MVGGEGSDDWEIEIITIVYFSEVRNKVIT